jgi:hypothetical protein
MRFYPAYTRLMVLEEYAVSFFALLNEAYRLRYVDALLKAQIGDLPNMNETDRKHFYQQLEWAGMHPSDILKPTGNSSNPDEIKKLLGGK